MGKFGGRVSRKRAASNRVEQATEAKINTAFAYPRAEESMQFTWQADGILSEVPTPAPWNLTINGDSKWAIEEDTGH